jgi:HEAT repeat protein
MRGDEAAAPGLLKALRERQDTTPAPECRGVKVDTPAWIPSIILLGRLGCAEAVPDIVAVMEDADSSLDARLSAIRALSRIGDAAAVPALEKLLEASHESVMRNLQTSSKAGKLKSPPQPAAWQIELTAAEALGRMGVARRDLVEKHADDQRALVRRRAAEVGRQLDAAGL